MSYCNLRVLFVLSGTFSASGGMYEYLKAWISDSESNNVIGVVAAKDVCDHLRTKYSGIFYYELPTMNYRALSLSRLISCGQINLLAEHIRIASSKHSADVIHIVDIPIYVDFLIKRLISENVKLYLTFHDPVPHFERISFFYYYYKRNLYRNLKLLATKGKDFHLHVHSNSLISTIADGKIKFIEMPHPLPKCQVPRSRTYFTGREGDVCHIGFMGRIDKYKGLEVLHAAFDKLSATNPRIPISAYIVGNGHLEPDTWDFSFPVKVINRFVSDDEFHKIMVDLDIVLIPYLEATQSGVTAMALAYGVPVIATNVGAIPDIVKHLNNGILIEPRDPNALAEAINQLVSAPQLYASILRKVPYEERKG